MTSPFAQLMAYLEEQHARHTVAYNARHPRTPGHAAVKTKPTSPDGGAVRSTPALHPTPHSDEPEEVQ